jgi:hypothetical protein
MLDEPDTNPFARMRASLLRADAAAATAQASIAAVRASLAALPTVDRGSCESLTGRPCSHHGRSTEAPGE